MYVDNHQDGWEFQDKKRKIEPEVRLNKDKSKRLIRGIQDYTFTWVPSITEVVTMVFTDLRKIPHMAFVSSRYDVVHT